MTSQPSFSITSFLFPSSPINTFLASVALLTLFLASLLYVFQGKLIYIPQLPPGSRSEVWLPSRFGYGPGIIKFSRKSKSKCCDHKHDDHEEEEDDDNDGHEHEHELEHENADKKDNFSWEELEIITPDKVKLQAYWLKASFKSHDIKQRISDDSDVPYTILYMQANAGNIVSPNNIIIQPILLF